MMHSTYSRTFAGVALAVLAVVSFARVPAGAQPQSAPARTASPRPAPSASAPPTMPTPVPVPSPITSLPPASQAATLPYPAYGTPAPGVDRGVAVPNVPQVITLDQAIAIGFAASPLLAQARAAVTIATAPVDLAKTAFLPNVAGTVSSSHGVREVGSQGSGQTGSDSNFQSNGLNISLAQLIYDGGKVADELRAAKATLNGSIATYKRQLQTVAFNVATAYYNALAAQRATQIANETVKIDQVNANLVAAQIAAGTAARSDYLTAELPVAQARVTLVKNQGAELSAQAAFVNAMGIDANILALPQDDGNVLTGASGIPQVPVPSYDQAITRALLLRPDYFAAQQNVVSFQQSLRAAKLGLWPHVNASASYGTNSTDVGGGNYRNSGDVGLTLSVPIFDQGITHAQVVQAQGQLDQAVASLNQTKESIQLNVKQTLVSLVSAQATFTQTQAELANAQQVLQATQAQFAAGVTTLPLLLDAQVGLTQALVDQVNAVYSLRQAEAAFLFAEGANAPA
jgi:outer membrane protein TolC